MAKSTAKSTARLYAGVHLAFLAWLHQEKLDYPATGAQVARYLKYCCKHHGPQSTVTHLTGIANLYRKDNLGFDSKIHPIGTVMLKIRKDYRKRKGIQPSAIGRGRPFLQRNST